MERKVLGGLLSCLWVLAVFCLIFYGSVGQAYSQNVWAKTYGGTGGEGDFYNIQPTFDGGYIASGITSSFGAGSYDAWVLKLDSNGNIQWQKTYGGASYDGVPFIIIGFIYAAICLSSCAQQSLLFG